MARSASWRSGCRWGIWAPRGGQGGGPQEWRLQGLLSGFLWTECTPTPAPLRHSLSPRRAWAPGQTLPRMQGFCSWERMCPRAGSFLLLSGRAGSESHRAHGSCSGRLHTRGLGPTPSTPPPPPWGLRVRVKVRGPSCGETPRAWTESSERKLVLSRHHGVTSSNKEIFRMLVSLR